MFKKAVTLNDAFLRFLTSREAMLVSPGTIRFYKFTAKKFIEWVNVKSIDDITSDHVRSYLSYLRNKNLSDSYIHSNARAIKTMLRFFYQEGYKSKLVKIDMPKLGYKRLIFLSIDELKNVIESCQNIRDKTIVLILVDSGIRRAELCNLNWEDVDLGSGILRIRIMSHIVV